MFVDAQLLMGPFGLFGSTTIRSQNVAPIRLFTHGANGVIVTLCPFMKRNSSAKYACLKINFHEVTLLKFMFLVLTI